MQHVITAVIKPHRLEEVKEALERKGVRGMTIAEVKGVGRQGGHTETYRGTEYRIDFVPKLRLEVVVPTEHAEEVAEAIGDAARTGSIGDGKIWMAPVDRVVRVRTGEVGDLAC